MKKFLLLAMTALMALTASSQELPAHDGIVWYGRVGLSINNATGGKFVKETNDYYSDHHIGLKESMGCRMGMSVDFGFQQPMWNGLYFGMELGLGTRGFSSKTQGNQENWIKERMTTWNVKCAPIIIGYKFPVTSDIKIDAHVGGFASCDWAGQHMSFVDSYGEKDKSDGLGDYGYNAGDAGIQAGVGIWWKRFNLDVTYQRGFIPMLEITQYYDSSSAEYKIYSSNVMVRLGVAF